MTAPLRSALFASAALLACGGRTTEKMEYGGHVLEPGQIVFAQLPLDEGAQTLLLINDRKDACAQFDGLGCLAQPLIGTSLFLRFAGFEARTLPVGDELSARWLDFQGVRPLQGEATAGTLDIEIARDAEELTGTFDLELPEGELVNGFTAAPCKPMRDYYLACGEEEP